MTEPDDEQRSSGDDAVETASGRVVNVTGIPLGSNLTADLAAGATVLPLKDAEPFDEITGGTVQIGDTTYTYAALGVDNDADTVTLDSGLVAAAAEGDRVDAWDPVNSEIQTEYRALVAVPGMLDNDEPLDATLSQSLALLLPEGSREPGEGESVTLELRDTEWVIVDVVGKTPAIQPDFVPSGGGGASNVVTGTQFDATGTSITSTTAGAGSSNAGAADGVAVGDGAYVETGADGAVVIGAGYAGGVAGVVIGNRAEADAAHGIAIGDWAWAIADGAVAIGRNTVANLYGGTDADAIAVGDGAAAQAESAIAIGASAQVTQGAVGDPGTQGIAIGSPSYASKDYAVCVGASQTTDKGAHGRSSVAVGVNAKTTAVAFGAVAIGNSAAAQASGAIAIGTADASGNDAVAIGNSASAPNADDFVLGSSSHHVQIPGRLNVARRTPTSSADTQGAVGDFTSDDSYVYVKTSAGWKRSALSTF